MYNPLRHIGSALAEAFKQMQFPRGYTTLNGSGYSVMSLPRGQARYRREVGDGSGSSLIVSCTSWLSRTFPEAPIIFEQRDDDGNWQQLFGHPIMDFVEHPNPAYSAVQMWIYLINDLYISGNAYSRIVPARSGLPAEQWYIPSTLIEPDSTSETKFISHYNYRPYPEMTEPQRIPVEQMLHFRLGSDPNDMRRGLSPLASVIREIYTDEEAGRFTAALLNNLGIPGIIISPSAADIEIDEEAALAAKLDWMAKFGGERRGEPLIIGTPTKVEQLSFSPQQMNLREIRYIPEERVTAVFGVPAAILGLGTGLAHSSFNNMAEAREAAYENTLLPLQRMVAADLNHQLLPLYFEDIAQRRRHRLRFDTSEVRVLAEDEQRKAQVTRVLTNASVIMVDEGRQRHGYKPVPNGAGRVFLRNLSTIEVPEGEVRPMEPEAAPAGGGGASPQSGTTDGGVGGFGGNQAQPHEVEAALHLGEEQIKAYGDRLYPAVGYFTKMAYAMRDLGVLAKQSDEQQTLLVDLASDADRLVEIYVKVWEQLLQDMAAQVISEIRRHEVVLAHLNGHSKGVEDWPGILRDIALGRRSVFDVLPNLNEMFARDALVDMYKAVAKSAYRVIGSFFNKPLPYDDGSLFAAEIIRAGGTRMGLMDFDNQARQALLSALADGVEAGDGTEQIMRRITRYVEGSHMYPGIAARHGDAAARAYRARLIVETEVRYAQNLGSVQAYRQSGDVKSVLISDGPACGWVFHDDPDLADGSERTLDDYFNYPIAHPRCVRVGMPVMA